MQVRRDVRLADLTTLAVGGPVERLVEVADAAELVAAVREADEAGRPLLVLGGGSNVVAPDEGWPGDVVAVRSRGIERSGAVLTVQAGEDWDDLVAHTVGERAGRDRGALRHPGLDRRDAGPERRRLRAGGRADDHRRPRLRPCGEVRADALAGGVRLRLPGQPAQAGPGPVRRPRRHVRPGGERGLAPGRLRRAGPDGSASSWAARRRWPTSARRSSSCVAARAWSWTRPIPTAAAPARSSPTRSSRRAQAVEGCPSWPTGDGLVKLSAAWLVAARRLRPRHAGGPRRDVVASTASRSRPSPARRRRSCSRSPTGSPPPVQERFGVTPGPRTDRRPALAAPARPCAARPARGGGRPSGRCSRGAAG